VKAGQKCECQFDNWHNYLGEKNTVLKAGMLLTVKARKITNGLLFYEFEETPEGHTFLGTGFKAVTTN
jgi:hypothetical protein